MNQSEYISVGKAAKLLGVHTDTIRHWTNIGKLKGYRTPTNQRKISVESIKEILKKEIKEIK